MYQIRFNTWFSATFRVIRQLFAHDGESSPCNVQMDRGIPKKALRRKETTMTIASNQETVEPSVSKLRSMQKVEQLVTLLKGGDVSSLARLRNELGKTRYELSLKVGVAEHTLEMWETGQQQPSGKQIASWRLKLSSYMDDIISDLLGTKDKEIGIKFWALMWELIDQNDTNHCQNP